ATHDVLRTQARYHPGADRGRCRLDRRATRCLRLSGHPLFANRRLGWGHDSRGRLGVRRRAFARKAERGAKAGRSDNGCAADSAVTADELRLRLAELLRDEFDVAVRIEGKRLVVTDKDGVTVILV